MGLSPKNKAAKTILMKSNENLIEELSYLGVFLNPKDLKAIRKAIKRDMRNDKKLKDRKRKLKMVAELRVNHQ